MRIQTRSSSKHLTFAAHTPHAISAESVVRSTQISARARIASRSGVGVGVGTASTTAKRSFDDDSPRMSQLKVLVDHAERRHCIGCRLRSNPGHGSRSRVCSDSTAIFTATRPRCVPRSPSRRRSQRSTTAPSARASDQIGDRETRRAKKVSTRPLSQVTHLVCKGSGVEKTPACGERHQTPRKHHRRRSGTHTAPYTACSQYQVHYSHRNTYKMATYASGAPQRHPRGATAAPIGRASAVASSRRAWNTDTRTPRSSAGGPRAPPLPPWPPPRARRGRCPRARVHGRLMRECF